jgi:hypothetical protein
VTQDIMYAPTGNNGKPVIDIAGSPYTDVVMTGHGPWTFQAGRFADDVLCSSHHCSAFALNLTHVDAARLDRITGTWLLAQARKYRDEDGGIRWVIAIDGKVMRGAWTDENDKVTLFSAMLQEEALTIVHVRVPDGTNEITQVKALAKELGIQAEKPCSPRSTPRTATM